MKCREEWNAAPTPIRKSILTEMGLNEDFAGILWHLLPEQTKAKVDMFFELYQ